MSKILKGVFLSDIHMPYAIDLKGVIEYLKDFKPDLVILGGDIVDASGMHGVDGFQMDKIDKDVSKVYYPRDCQLMKDFITKVQAAAGKQAEYVFLEGNHEERYQRIAKRYPEVVGTKFNFPRDGFPKDFVAKWIKYGDYDSFYRVGDTLFTHGTLYPEGHSKKYAYYYSPDKVVYGHIHDYQAFTIHRGDPSKPTKFAVTGGCLCELTPDYKKGAPHKWTNGFVSFICRNDVTIPTVHLIEKGVFNIGGRIYGV